ncbi:signal peptidase I [Thalassotalea piscium]|uniref:Signal peptidase I n=1 Tax=Thalassotalea piscium TaxID=1230533 RepID=A0A7X0NGJ3_9GAMM|nr:signal peptidase I [Thalassotalea piscium]MBB6543067.1 signal peptidase I [Thalassotalea piscium]
MKLTKLHLSILAIGLTVFSIFEFISNSSWKLSYEEQAYLRCLPIELTLTHYGEIKSTDLGKGDLVAVNPDKYKDFYREGVTLLKVIAGVPGDEIFIADGKVFINGDFVSVYSTHESAKLNPFKEGKFKLEDDQYWIAGSTSVSLDSRYIGPVNLESIIGKGYAII